MTDGRDAAGLDAVLEALSFERRRPDARAFEELFLRFSRRVACETLTRPAGEPESFDAERFFAEWVEEETGLAGGERARAFEWLARGIGFDASFSEGTCLRPWEINGRDEAHRAVIATIEGRRVLADAGLPLPVLLPLDPPAQDIPTGMGRLSATFVADRSVTVTCDARGEVSELLNLHLVPAKTPIPFEELSRTLPVAEPWHDARGSRSPFALRLLDDRVLFWCAGRMTVLDAWSRLEYPLASSSRAALEKLFALELEGVALPKESREALAAPATLSVFHESPVSAEEARGRIARAAPPLSLIVGREVLVEETVAGSRITIESALAPTLPAEGPTEAVRKTLVFHLVSELFELSRG